MPRSPNFFVNARASLPTDRRTKSRASLLASAWSGGLAGGSAGGRARGSYMTGMGTSPGASAAASKTIAFMMSSFLVGAGPETPALLKALQQSGRLHLGVELVRFFDHRVADQPEGTRADFLAV